MAAAGGIRGAPILPGVRVEAERSPSMCGSLLDSTTAWAVTKAVDWDVAFTDLITTSKVFEAVDTQSC